MEKGFQSVWKKFGPKSKTRYNEIESWMQGHPEWPILSSPKMHSREKATSPVSKSYPFTVEVIAEGKDDSLQQKLDFSPKIRRNNDEDIHSNAAIVLNSTSVSWQLLVNELLNIKIIVCIKSNASIITFKHLKDHVGVIENPCLDKFLVAAFLVRFLAVSKTHGFLHLCNVLAWVCER